MITKLSELRKEDSNYKRFKENMLFSRTRGLDKLQERFNEDIIGHIKDISKRQKVVRILEIGFGEGKALLEAASLGSNIFVYGISERKTHTVSSVSDLLHNAKKFNINIHNNPKIFFYDAGLGLKFKDNQFDIIFSQTCIHYVGDKARLFEEIWRVLKKDGQAYLHFDSRINGKQPDFMYQYKDTPRFIIYDKKRKIIPTKILFDKIKSKGFDINCSIGIDKSRSIQLVMKKNTTKPLKLGLDYDGNSTLYLTRLRETDEYKFDTGIWWGTRSVYSIK